jgi:hypothetical protein
MKKLVAGLMTLGALNAAHAINLTFQFDVQSSGSSIYACNAGLQHPTNQSVVCYDRYDLGACNPNACQSEEECNCVCTGGLYGTNHSTSRAGHYRLDYLTAQYANWTDNGEAMGHLTSVNKYAKNSSNYGTYNQLFHGVDFNHQLKELHFVLGSERYGAEYFLDVCYRAPQVDYPTNVTLNYRIDESVTITDLVTSAGDTNFDLDNSGTNYYTDKPYYELANLQVKSITYCKDKSGHVVVNKETPWKSFSTAQNIALLSGHNVAKDLKGCFVRYKFREMNTTGIDSIRKWKKQEARVCTYTSVNEPEQN